ncbi:glycerate kinase [Bacteroidota bacterium]
MKILLAPDSFKSSLSSNEVCNILYNELINQIPDLKITRLPQSDGGEGSLEVISEILNADEITLTVSGPFSNSVDTKYLYNKKNKTAYIESALAYGLTLIPRDKKDCKKASSYGSGELIKHAVLTGAKRIIVFLGGSAGNDGGTGLASALGYVFYDKYGNQLKGSGENLIKINEIDNSGYIFRNMDIKIIAACDVDNPFYGPNGAAITYSAQKGASAKETEMLDKGMKNLANKISTKFNINIQNIPGSGAAGGLGGGLSAFLFAELQSGADIIAEITALDKHIKDADLIISGEGSIDTQTLHNKLLRKLCLRAQKHSVPVWSVCGYFEGNNKLKSDIGIQKIFSLVKSKEEIQHSVKNARTGLKTICKEIAWNITSKI